MNMRAKPNTCAFSYLVLLWNTGDGVSAALRGGVVVVNGRAGKCVWMASQARCWRRRRGDGGLLTDVSDRGVSSGMKAESAAVTASERLCMCVAGCAVVDGWR